MKNFYKFAFTFCIVIFIYGCASYKSKDNNLTVVLSKTEQAITRLSEKIATTDNDSLAIVHGKLEKKSKELFPALEKCNEKYRLSKNYMVTLEVAQKKLEHLQDNFESLSHKAFVLDAIYRDYDAMLTSINSSAKNDANTKVRVIVDSSEDEGFFVFGKLSYEQELDIKRFRFNRPTHNASLDFVPGYYLLWLEKEDRVGEPELHLITDNGKEEEKKLVLKTPK